MRIVRQYLPAFTLQALILFAMAVAIVANPDAAQAAAGKKTKHAKTTSATTQTHAPNNTQNAVPGPPDPGVYK